MAAKAAAREATKCRRFMARCLGDKNESALQRRTYNKKGPARRCATASRNSAWPRSRLSGSAHGEPFDAKRRLSDAHGHVLPVLAAHAHAGVEAHVVADERHARERVGAVADEGR